MGSFSYEAVRHMLLIISSFMYVCMCCLLNCLRNLISNALMVNGNLNARGGFDF